MILINFLKKCKTAQRFLGKGVGLEILYYLSEHDKIFIAPLAKELDHTWGQVSNELKNLLYLDLIKVDKEEKARGRAKKRRFHSITEEGRRTIQLLTELSLLLNER